MFMMLVHWLVFGCDVWPETQIWETYKIPSTIDNALLWNWSQQEVLNNLKGHPVITCMIWFCDSLLLIKRLSRCSILWLRTLLTHLWIDFFVPTSLSSFRFASESWALNCEFSTRSFSTLVCVCSSRFWNVSAAASCSRRTRWRLQCSSRRPLPWAK